MLAEQFAELFQGSDKGYYISQELQRNHDGKIKCRVRTIRRYMTLQDYVPLWQEHLKGVEGLITVPINSSNKCFFGAIDIDVYIPEEHKRLYNLCKELELPLIPCNSKSGGIHFYLFCKEWTPAKALRKLLRSLASKLGCAKAEIFPKQTSIQGDELGQGLNMPYFKDSRTCVTLKPEQFLEEANKRKVNSEYIEISQKPIEDQEFADGPVCLQHLASQGIPEGTRNKTLFNVGVYCRKKFSDSWDKELEKLHHKLFPKKLPSSEVQAIITSLKKKEYNFTCNDEPICHYCDRITCQTRKHGVKGSEAIPLMTSLRKLLVTPPVWRLELEGKGAMQLATEDLQLQERFQRKCMEHFNYMPHHMPRDDWTKLINTVLKNAIEEDVPEELKNIGRFKLNLMGFLNGKLQAKTLEDLQIYPYNKPYNDDDYYWFKTKGLEDYFNRIGFKDYVNKSHLLTANLKEIGAETKVKRINGLAVRVWRLPFDKVDDV